MSEKVLEATVKAARFDLIYRVFMFAFQAIATAVAWAFFGWKMALVVFLVEWSCGIAAKRRQALSDYWDTLKDA